MTGSTATGSIRTPGVMLSSTVADLVEIRRSAHAVCADLGLTIVAMEDGIASADSARAFSIDLVDRADVYVGIVAASAGSRPDGDELNYTSLEYQRARLKPLPRLLFLSEIEDEQSLDRQIADLRKTMLDDPEAVAAFFGDEDEFAQRLRDSLVQFLQSWRNNRGLNPDHAELVVGSGVVEQKKDVEVRVIAAPELLAALRVCMAEQEFEPDSDGYVSIPASAVGKHEVELKFGSGAAAKVVGREPVTVVSSGGHMGAFALLGAFCATTVWVMLGTIYPDPSSQSAGYERSLPFVDDILGHVLIAGALIGAACLGAVYKRVRAGLGDVLLLADLQWRTHRWWIAAVIITLMSVAAWFNVQIIQDNKNILWWSEAAGLWAVSMIAFGYFLLALAPILLIIVRIGLSLRLATSNPTSVLTYDPASPDGHFGLAWLGNTMLGFLALASIPLSMAAIAEIQKPDATGLGVPIAILLGLVVIGLLGAFPLFSAYPRLEGRRQFALAAEKRGLARLQDMQEAALTDREREERKQNIGAVKKRLHAIENASAIAMGRRGAACAIFLGVCLLAPLVAMFGRR